MNVTSRTITVGWDVDGYHNWPDAPPHRGYLADPHRHRFEFEVTVPVDHEDRAIEFHDLLDALRAIFPSPYDFGPWSCEKIAAVVAEFTIARFDVEWTTVSVSEDGYVTGTVYAERDAR